MEIFGFFKKRLSQKPFVIQITITKLQRQQQMENFCNSRN